MFCWFIRLHKIYQLKRKQNSNEQVNFYIHENNNNSHPSLWIPYRVQMLYIMK